MCNIATAAEVVGCINNSQKTETSGSRGENGSWHSYIIPSMQRKITKLNYEIIEEVKRAQEDSHLSQTIRDELERLVRNSIFASVCLQIKHLIFPKKLSLF